MHSMLSLGKLRKVTKFLPSLRSCQPAERAFLSWWVSCHVSHPQLLVVIEIGFILSFFRIQIGLTCGWLLPVNPIIITSRFNASPFYRPITMRLKAVRIGYTVWRSASWKRTLLRYQYNKNALVCWVQVTDPCCSSSCLCAHSLVVATASSSVRKTAENEISSLSRGIPKSYLKSLILATTMNSVLFKASCQ